MIYADMDMLFIVIGLLHILYLHDTHLSKGVLHYPPFPNTRTKFSLWAMGKTTRGQLESIRIGNGRSESGRGVTAGLLWCQVYL
jgi:hypothetical protein